MLENELKIKLLYEDGIVGRGYYMTLNGVRIDIESDHGDYNKARDRACEIFLALGIDYDTEIEFEHSGLM